MPAALFWALVGAGGLLFLGRTADQAGDAADQASDFFRSIAVLVAIATLAFLVVRK